MLFENSIKKYLMKKNVKYQNIIEAIYWNTVLRQITGLSVIVVESIGGTLDGKLSILGLLGFIIYCTLYSYCVYVVNSENQTIIRIMFDTKLQQYGDLFENLVTVAFVFYVMMKVGFLLSNDVTFAQKLVDVDKFIDNMAVFGVSVDYIKHFIASIYMVVIQEILWVFRLLTIFAILHGEDGAIPVQKIFQGAYFDALSLGSSSVYCYYVFIWAEKYFFMNTILIKIKEKKIWEQSFIVRFKGGDDVKLTHLQDKYICEKIRMCAKLNTKLYSGIKHINNVHGISIALTTFLCISYIILYMFYFMEATAAGLFHDTQRYLRLLVFLVWQIAYCIFVLVVIVYYTENILAEARKTPMILHEIIHHKDFSPAVKREAMKFSVQLLHEVPILRAHGLCVINRCLLYDGGRLVLQLLVMLLQFVDTK